MNPVIQLVRVKHGSHLYGTSTPASDQDFKGVHLPSGEAIILQRAENHIRKDVVSKIEGTAKNASDAIDDESFSVQRFFEMLMKGDTVATEILFAPREAITYQHPCWTTVRSVGMLLLNRQCKGFVGYCVRQAAKYGIKGSRMADVRALLDHLEIVRLGRPVRTTKLGDVEESLRRWSEGREHVSWENIPSPNGADLWHIVCCDRKMPMTASLDDALNVYSRVWHNYGERARAAMSNEGIDWKAMSHAVRVAGQAIELLETGHITFPRPNARLLLDIKLGLLPYGAVGDMLEKLVVDVRLASERSILPETSNHKLADETVALFYAEQVRDRLK